MLGVTLSQLLGQPEVSAFLKGVVAGGRFANAYLFHGPAGVGNRPITACVATGTVVAMEGRLRRVLENTWVGELHGYHVHISEQDGSRYVALMPGGQGTERMLRVDSLEDGARLARAWIEKRLRAGE